MLQNNNIDKYLQNGIFDISEVNPADLWDLATEGEMDNEFFSVLTLCFEGIAEIVIKQFNKREKASDIMRLHDVEKLIERFYSDGIMKEENMRNIIKMFAKIATLTQAGKGKNTPLLSRLGHKWFIS